MSSKVIGAQFNTPVARMFRDIVTSGWATKSDGNVETPTGHFALVLIEPAERAELCAAVWETDEDVQAALKAINPGDYMVFEDSDGNAQVFEYIHSEAARDVYKQMERDFALWAPTCPSCGEESTVHERDQFDKDNRHKCAACGHIWDPTGEYEEPVHELEPGWRPQVVSELEDEPEKLFLVCDSCGEAFDEIKAAYAHLDTTGVLTDGCNDTEGFSIKPESEAM